MKLHPDFRDLLSEFARESVEFLVIGGYAVGYHDRPRYTKDLDLWIGATGANIAAAARGLVAFGAPDSIVDALRAASNDEIVWMGTPPLRVDFLRDVSGVRFEDAWPRREVVDWGGVPVPILGLGDLIATKRAAGRDRDLLDVKHLERALAKKQ